jgi:SAM-dependent methyltransferase
MSYEHRSMTSSDLGPTSDFLAVACRYDATRDVPQKHLRACYERLVHYGLISTVRRRPRRRVRNWPDIDRACRDGLRVHGIDISPEMIARAQAKCRPEWCARYTVGDVRALRRNNDAVVVSKLLMHVGDWQAACREFVRVLRPGACIVQLDDAASFGHPVRKYFARRADALGFTNRFIGFDPRDFTRLVQFFAA